MALLKCKMCGGDVEISEDKTFGTCEYCGNTMTFPKTLDDQRVASFNRGNHFRRVGEFDKALAVYESIIRENDADAEAHWCAALCRFGIEYVEDPISLEWLPTCHRASFDSFLEDVDYLAALEYSDGITKKQYQKDAAKIAEVQRGILATSQNEEPFDVFICYKESDENGNRTVDSTLAQDIYYQLNDAGYKTFFAKITLEDKVGSEYEPYIFAALNSAKVMVVVGTSKEHLDAVWVKNEWSRFLAMMRKDRNKLLLPCYRDMDPYDMPEALSVLQSYDMSKIGFVQDLIRGIKKVINKEDEKQVIIKEVDATTKNVSGAGNTNALIKRGNMALEDGEWQKAEDFFEEVLNQNAECAEAYLGKLLAKYKQPSVEQLTKLLISKYEASDAEILFACDKAVDRIEKALSYKIDGFLTEAEIKHIYEFNREYKSSLSCRKQQRTTQLAELDSEKLLTRTMQYAEGDTKSMVVRMLDDVTAVLDERVLECEQADKKKILSIKSSYEKHLDDADLKAKETYENALKRQEDDYNSKVDKMHQAKTISDYEIVKGLLMKMHGYRDTIALADKCQKEIDRLNREYELEQERIKEEKELRRKKHAKKVRFIVLIPLSVIVVSIALALVSKYYFIPNYYYNKGIALRNENKFEEAIDIFSINELTYKDTEAQIDKTKYQWAIYCKNNEKYGQALEIFNGFGEKGYKDSLEQSKIVLGMYPQAANVGSEIIFGSYNNKPLEWIVIDREEDSILLLSKYVLEDDVDNAGEKFLKWEDSYIRKWLNSSFYSNAFSSDEARKIKLCYVNNGIDENCKWWDKWSEGYNGLYEGPYDGKDITHENVTEDKIFLLSAEETKKLLPGMMIGSDLNGETKQWVLRNRGTITGFYKHEYKSWKRAFVDKHGDINPMINDFMCIRPAMWIGEEE